MPISAHPQHLLNHWCGHESQNQNGSSTKRSRQITIFRLGLSSLAAVIGDFGEVRCTGPKFSHRSLELSVRPVRLQRSEWDFHTTVDEIVPGRASDAVKLEWAHKRESAP
jgi:hypothetical protein